MKSCLVLLALSLLAACSHGPTRSPASLEDQDGIYNNPEYTPIYDLIRQAQSTIDVEIYEMYNTTFLKLLLSKIHKNVRVRIVKDATPVGKDSCHLFENKPVTDSEEKLACLLQKQIKEKATVVPYNKAVFCKSRTCFEHGKMIIVDGKRALLSSGNFNNSNLCDAVLELKTCNRDYTYVTSDPETVAALSTIFENDLRGKPYDLPAILKSGDLKNKITVSPYSSQPLIGFVNKAKKTLQIENQYMKDPSWNNSLKEAAQRGVEVTLQVSSLTEFGALDKVTEQKLCSLFQDFENNKVNVRLFTSEMEQGGRKGYLHAKAMVADGERAWMGSVNGSTTSLSENREFGIFFNNPERVAYLSKILADDFNHPKSLSWKDQLNCKP